MSEDHKSALAQGRHEGRVVRDYLQALRANKPRRGRRRTAASINARLETIGQQLETAAPIDELRLLQERRDLLDELGTVDDATGSCVVRGSLRRGGGELQRPSGHRVRVVA